jgi:hypothetical protein
MLIAPSMSTLRRCLLPVSMALVAVLALGPLAPARAASTDVAGVAFEDQAAVVNQPVELNGAGLRVKMIIKVYAIGLYLPRKVSEAAQAITMPGPKSLRIVMLRDVGAERLTESLVQGVQDNASKAEQLALQDRLKALEDAMRQLGEAAKGAHIDLDYVPGAGTRISMQGKPVLKDIPGEDFYRALMKIWLGDDPADKHLKLALLGQP